MRKVQNLSQLILLRLNLKPFTHISISRSIFRKIIAVQPKSISTANQSASSDHIEETYVLSSWCTVINEPFVRAVARLTLNITEKSTDLFPSVGILLDQPQLESLSCCVREPSIAMRLDD